MSWLEVTVEVDEKRAMGYGEQLESIGALAISFFDAQDQPLLEPAPGTTPLWNKVKIVGLFAQDTDKSTLQKKLKETFPTLTFQMADLVEQEWTRTWLDHFKPMQFGERLWVAPVEEAQAIAEQENAVVLKLDPGLAFGTGTHQTTALCLEWLDAHPPVNHQVIDYGCGSGILGIAALLLGAQKVWAIDYDPQALMSTQENALRNDIPEENLIRLLPSDLESNPLPTAQLVLANILAEPLIELAPAISQCCAKGGYVVLSGLLTSQAEAVKAAYLPWFTMDEMVVKEDWVLLAGVRK